MTLTFDPEHDLKFQSYASYGDDEYAIKQVSANAQGPRDAATPNRPSCST